MTSAEGSSDFDSFESIDNDDVDVDIDIDNDNDGRKTSTDLRLDVVTGATAPVGSLFSPRPLVTDEAASNGELFSPRAGLTALADKESSKERRNSVRIQLHSERARRSIAQIAIVVFAALCCVALPTSIAAFVLIAQFEPAARPLCPNTPLGTWAAVVGVFNIVALLALLPWIVRPHRVKRYIALIALWLIGATQIGLVIWGATFWLSGSPPAKCVAAYGGSSAGLGVMATILFAFTIAIWLTVCLGLLGNNINSKLRSAEIELGVTPPDAVVDGETAQQKWERERDERNGVRHAPNRVPVAPAKSVYPPVVAAAMVDANKKTVEGANNGKMKVVDDNDGESTSSSGSSSSSSSSTTSEKEGDLREEEVEEVEESTKPSDDTKEEQEDSDSSNQSESSTKSSSTTTSTKSTSSKSSTKSSS